MSFCVIESHLQEQILCHIRQVCIFANVLNICSYLVFCCLVYLYTFTGIMSKLFFLSQEHYVEISEASG